MPDIVSGHNCLDSWQKAAKYLLVNKKEAANLIVSTENPVLLNEAWLLLHNPYRIKPNSGRKNDIRNVINTIFPYKLLARSSSTNDFYENYRRINEHGKNKRVNRSAWGTYFERLTYFAGELNQLERVISKLNDWEGEQSAAFVFHLSSPSLDAPRKLGSPCWQYAQLSESSNTLDLTVVYRNHDYFTKTLGNFIGLGQLLQYICTRTGRKPGKLICHSIHAYYSETNDLMNKLINGEV
jgi:thymidylate synthase